MICKYVFSIGMIGQDWLDRIVLFYSQSEDTREAINKPGQNIKTPHRREPEVRIECVQEFDRRGDGVMRLVYAQGSDNGSTGQ